MVLCNPFTLKLNLCFPGGVEKAENMDVRSKKIGKKMFFVFNVFVFKWGKFNTFGGILRKTGCSVAWLARHVRDVEVGSSNLPTPTRIDIGSVAQLDRATDF